MAKINRCGDSGGRTRQGQPCRFRVANVGLRCSAHPREWDADAPPPATGDEVGKPAGDWWDKAVSAAYLRLCGSTSAEAAAGAGIGERTMVRWEGCSWWQDAIREAERRWLNHTRSRAMRTLHRGVDEDLATARWFAERTIADLAPPKQRTESTQFPVDLTKCSEEELELLSQGMNIVEVFQKTRGLQAKAVEGEDDEGA